MSGRNRGPPSSMVGVPRSGLPPPVHEPPYARGLRPMPPHPNLLEEMRESQFGIGPRGGLPPHPAIIEDHIAAQLQDIQALLADNQQFAATHVALKQELEAAQYELQRIIHYADSLRPDNDVQLKEMYEKSVQLETELHAVDAMRAELFKIRSDIKQLTAQRMELTTQVQYKNQDWARIAADLQQVPPLKAEIDNMKQELQHARAAIEHEKKKFTENYEHGQAMEKKLISMARELEKLRAEVANVEHRAHAAAPVGNPAVAAYNANYGNLEQGYPIGYAMNPGGYAMNPVQAGVEGYPQYAPSGSWGVYDMQQAQRQR